MDINQQYGENNESVISFWVLRSYGSTLNIKDSMVDMRSIGFDMFNVSNWDYPVGSILRSKWPKWNTITLSMQYCRYLSLYIATPTRSGSVQRRWMINTIIRFGLEFIQICSRGDVFSRFIEQSNLVTLISWAINCYSDIPMDMQPPSCVLSDTGTGNLPTPFTRRD